MGGSLICIATVASGRGHSHEKRQGIPCMVCVQWGERGRAVVGSLSFPTHLGKCLNHVGLMKFFIFTYMQQTLCLKVPMWCLRNLT